MDPAPTQYIDRDGAALAYQVVGDGEHDVVALLALNQHIDLAWTDPDMHALFERNTALSRSVHMQERGFGLSDRLSYTPTLEQHASDVLAVMDAIGLQEATLVGIAFTSAAVSLVAAQHPDRVKALVLFNPISSLGPTGDASLDAELAELVASSNDAFDDWGTGRSIRPWDVVQDTPYNRRLMALLERSSATPAAARAYLDWLLQLDYAEVLKSVQAPTRVLHLPTGLYPERAVRRAADLIPNATFRSLPPTQPGASIGQALRAIHDAIIEVTTGQRPPVDLDRVFGTVLFTDLVSSTELLARLGDAEYKRVRSDHERQVRLAVGLHGGELVTVMGDGTLSVFDSPNEAVRCAEMVRRDAAKEGLAVRCGLHAGELERDGGNVTGMTVHVGARVGSAAGAGEIAVSSSVRDLVVGSGLEFASLGGHELKGVPGSWELFGLTHTGDQYRELSTVGNETRLDRMAVRSARRMPRTMRAMARAGQAVERRRARARA